MPMAQINQALVGIYTKPVCEDRTRMGPAFLPLTNWLSESTQIFVQFLMQKKWVSGLEKGVLLCLFPIFQEMLLSVSLVHYHKTGVLVGVLKQGILMLHNHTLWLCPMLKQRQAAACSCTGLRQLETHWERGCSDPRALTRLLQRWHTEHSSAWILELSNLRGLFQL